MRLANGDEGHKAGGNAVKDCPDGGHRSARSAAEEEGEEADRTARPDP